MPLIFPTVAVEGVPSMRFLPADDHRYDHITFAEAGEAFALDLPGGLEFGAIVSRSKGGPDIQDWNRPINEQRQRRGTSKLSSLNTHSSHSTYEGGMLLDYDSDDDSRRSEDESDVGRGRKRNSSMATIDTINKRPRLPTREPDVMDFNPIELDILGDPLLEDISDDPMQAPMDDLNAEPPSPGKEREGSHEWVNRKVPCSPIVRPTLLWEGALRLPSVLGSGAVTLRATGTNRRKQETMRRQQQRQSSACELTR